MTMTRTEEGSFLQHGSFLWQGFLNINCGASTNQTSSNGVLWIPDIPFTRSRNASFVNAASIATLPFQTFAYFTNLEASKYCYLVPVMRGTRYLVRATFWNGAFETGIPLASIFDLFIDGVKWFEDLTDMQGNHVFRNREMILAAKSDRLSLCLARNSYTEKTNYLFISTIELRPVIYNSTDFHKKALVSLERRHFDSYNYIRYPVDEFDRMWEPYTSTSFDKISTAVDTFGKSLANQPPVAVLQTAISTTAIKEGDLIVPYSIPNVYEGGSYYFALYFCNIKESNLSITNKFQVFINNQRITDWLQFSSFLQCQVVERNLEFGVISSVNITLHPGEGSETGPFINAAEVYQIRDIQNMTHLGDGNTTT